MGWVPPQYSPKYPEVARKYLRVKDSLTPNVVTAKAAITIGPWQRVIHSMYPMPLASFRSDSANSSECGGFRYIRLMYDYRTYLSLSL
jgi:hypothetical protein